MQLPQYLRQLALLCRPTHPPNKPTARLFIEPVHLLHELEEQAERRSARPR